MMKSSEVNRWLTLTHLSREERKQKQPNWDKIFKYFRGLEWNLDDETKKEVVTVNLVYGHVKIVVPSVYFSNPYIYFRPNKPSSVDYAKLTEFVINNDMEQMKLKVTNKSILNDVILYGTGYSKLTYELDEGAEEFDIEDAMENKFNNVEAVINEPFEIPANGPRGIKVGARDITFTVGATDFGDPGFVSHHVRKRLMDVKNDKYYKNTKDLQPTLVAKDELRKNYGGAWNSEVDEYLQMVDLEEVWDPSTGLFCVLAWGHDKPLRDWQENPYPVIHPFDILRFTPLEDQMWGLSEIEPWIPQLNEINENRTQSKTHIKRYNRKYAANEKSVDEDELNKLTSGEDGVVVKVRGDIPAQQAVIAIQDAPMPADVYRHGLQAENDQVKISGISSYQRGEQPPGSDTATEAAIIDRGGKTRDGDRISCIADFVLSQAEKIRLYRRKFTPGTEMFRMTDDPSVVEQWAEWSKEDIDVSSQMRISYGSTMPIDQSKRQNDSLLLYDRALANPTVNPQSAFSNLLEAFDQRDQTKWFLPQAIIQLQLLQKALGQQKQQQKGVSATAGQGNAEPGPVAPETSAEMRGRAATGGG